MATSRLLGLVGYFGTASLLLIAFLSWALVRQYRRRARARHQALYPPGRTPQDVHALEGGVGLEDFDLEGRAAPFAPSRRQLPGQRLYTRVCGPGQSRQ